MDYENVRHKQFNRLLSHTPPNLGPKRASGFSSMSTHSGRFWASVTVTFSTFLSQGIIGGCFESSSGSPFQYPFQP
jgi:hypothetical protein